VTERRSSADLGSAAETMLSSFPFPERDWESDARALEARLSASVRGSTDAALLAAPLPSEPAEPTSAPATTTPLASSGVRTQSLAEMARRSVEQKQATERAIARESLALAAQSRPTSEQAAVLREAVSAVRAVQAPPAPADANAAPSAGAAAVSARGPLASAKAQTSWPKLGLVAGAFALAAGVFLWLRQPAPAPLVGTALQPAAEQPKPESPSALAPAPGGGADRAAAAEPAAVAVDPSTLSQEGTAQTADSKHSKVAAAAASAAPAVSASAAGPSPEKLVLEDDPPSAAPTAAVAEKPIEKALPPDPALRPADSTGGAIPVKPSTGAVQAALGAVMSGARHCVAGDDAASSAVVVFASDGRVESVTVHGPAAGKPSGTCIEGQLSRARVQPFAASSFSINATVRPD
jgi:hypothetical protein